MVKIYRTPESKILATPMVETSRIDRAARQTDNEPKLKKNINEDLKSPRESLPWSSS